VSGASLLHADLRSGNQAHSLHHIWTPGPAAVNEARFNFSRFQQHHSFADPVLLGNPAVNGDVASVTTPGLTRLGMETWEGQIRAQNNFQWTDDLSIQRGLHSLKTGGVVRRLQSNNGVFNDSVIGQLQFLNIADFLTGKPQSYSRNIGNPYIGLRATEYNMYLQDDWRIQPRLTLNLGVRYELNTVPLEVNGLIPDRFRIPPDHNNVAPRSASPRARTAAARLWCAADTESTTTLSKWTSSEELASTRRWSPV
jgi:outer membrane receptor protein involved in Fe transport